MTWAEFRIRSFAFKRLREWEMKMVREVSYEVHTLKYMFGKQSPPKKERYWPIEPKKTVLTDRQRNRLIQAYQEYKKQKGEG